MSKNIWIGIIAALAVAGGVQHACQPEWYDARMDRVEDAMTDLGSDLADVPSVLTRDYLKGISKDACAFSDRLKAVNEIKPSKIDDEGKKRLAGLKESLASFDRQLGASLLCKPVQIVSTSGSLLDSIATIPVWLEQGETLSYSVSSDKPLDVSLYNYDSRTQLASFKDTRSVSRDYVVPYSAIYLLRLVPDGRQYVTLDVKYKANSLDRLMRPAQVEISHESGYENDALARKIQGIEMNDAFNEPQKVTLRSGLKSAFSGSTRSLIPVQITGGATDLLYNLQISNNENKENEKDFSRGMNNSYRKIRVLGLPIYDSQRGSGLLTRLLGLNTPVKEEESYANMYVFFDADQARKFQNGEPVTKLRYSLDHSVQGTQSRNGRIPAGGHKTVYLGFENERMRYSTYIWLSALLSKPVTEIVTTTYKAVPPVEGSGFVEQMYFEK